LTVPQDDAVATLLAAVRRAQASREREVRFGSARLERFLRASGRAALWEVVDSLTMNHSHVYEAVGSEGELESLVVDALANGGAPDLSALAAKVMASARQQPIFLVAIGLANCAPPREVQRLRRDVALAPAPTPTTSWASHQRGVLSALGDAFAPLGRVAHGTQDGETMDSRIGATLFFRERGPLRMARLRAETKARYALAVWCTLEPPGDRDKSGFTLWPSVANWIAKPAVAVEHPVRELRSDPDGRRHARVRSSELQYADYDLPPSRRGITAPFRAMARAEQHHHSAGCLLSAAICVWEALHIPGEHSHSARALHLRAAVDALCDPPPGIRGRRDDRWPAVCERLKVDQALARQGHSLQSQARSWKAFNVARSVRSHGSDAYALDVGAGLRSTRRQGVPRSELAPALARADLGRVAEGVLLATRQLWRLMDARGWDDALYEQQFAPASKSP
jgi:hypothetical protein